ncbi:TonB-dependent receptor [Thalassotalea sp. LPB0316]|uniref:TonB-dependent receptor n=1 Tax=Thalassotalea sp. LPB0316 TaxID=2769490 RepID=UPI0018661D0B|nr:TonB-dependent receptor [Thalassotalea sp. LPB0316]QOL24565.1 TonB-dependent receptor [Thalassotalea sp. LPB0316]
MNYKKFNKTKLASSLSLILGASMASPALAEEAQAAQEIEVIEVTGIRGSMIKSMDLKRSSSGVMDAISAEDIGKFPDTNLAESLQRISGVSIDRNNGEGNSVTVRGFAPDRNLVMLNGRQLPTTNGSRSFDFANVASEGVSGVEVYKTSEARIPTGGIGASINVLTSKPLDHDGRKASFGIKMMDDTSASDGSITPELSGIYSDTFDDGKFGVSINASYAERESGNQQALVGTGWRSFTGETDQDWSGSNAAWGGVPQDGQVNRPGPGDIYSVPQTTIYKFEEQQRTRLNSQLVLQYRPNDNFTATADWTYYETEIDRQFNDVSAWYTFAPSENVWTDGPISSPLLYSEDYIATGAGVQDYSMAASKSATRDEMNSFGINLEWQLAPNFRLELDHHSSDAERTPNSPHGSSNTLSTAAFIREAAATDFTGALPILAVRGSSNVQPSDMRVTGSVFSNAEDYSEVDQTHLSGTYDFEEIGSIDFGVMLMTSSKHSKQVNVQRNDWGGVGAEGDFDDSFFPAASIQDRFDDVSGGNFADFDGSYEIADRFFMWDFDAVRDIAAQLYTPDSFPAGTVIGDCGNMFCPSTNYAAGTDRYVEEDITSVYLQYNYQGEMGTMPFDVHFGFRYEQTEVESTSAVPEYNGTVWVGDTEIELTGTGGFEYQTKSGKYDHILPSINFNLEVTEDIIVRAAYSETIGRPWYGDLQGGTVLGTLANRLNGSGSSGNPNLKPLESKNWDFSFEWYYAEGSYAAIAYFDKKVKNNIDPNTVEYTFDGLFNPSNGPKSSEAIGAVGSDAGNIRQYIFDNYEDGVTVYEENGVIKIAGVPEDQLLNFLINEPQNSSEEQGYDGMEFTVQHLFGETGFGVMANYTLVNTDNEFDNFVLDAQVAETNISDTANFIAFYDNGGFQARIAYNWRDDFLAATGTDTGANPVYTQDYQQVDFNMSYDIPQVEGLAVFFEGINITNEYTRQYGRATHQVINVTQQGARYTLGARYNF